MNATMTPHDVEIRPRDWRFGRGTRRARWWLNDDPVATAFYNAMSVTFPKGEAFFVESVRAHRDGAPPRLEREINAFIRQEVAHSREHVAFNRHVVDQGYDVTLLETHVDEALALTKGRPPIANLVATMALEHFTAIFAHELIAEPRHLAGAEPEAARMWRWHAMEEIEHKGVAYDAWLHATRDWPGRRRWLVRTLVMLRVTRQFVSGRVRGMAELLRQDGLTGPWIWWRMTKHGLGRPGMARRIIPAWLSWFRPGFHPWMHDDRALIAQAESQFADALFDASGEAPVLPRRHAGG